MKVNLIGMILNKTGHAYFDGIICDNNGAPMPAIESLHHMIMEHAKVANGGASDTVSISPELRPAAPQGSAAPTTAGHSKADKDSAWRKLAVAAFLVLDESEEVGDGTYIINGENAKDAAGELAEALDALGIDEPDDVDRAMAPVDVRETLAEAIGMLKAQQTKLAATRSMCEDADERKEWDAIDALCSKLDKLQELP